MDGEPKSSGVESNGGAGGVAGRAAVRLSGDPGCGAATAATGDDAGVEKDSLSPAAPAGDAKPAGGTSPAVIGRSSGATTLIPSLCSLRKSKDDDSAEPGSKPVALARLRLEVRSERDDALGSGAASSGSGAASWTATASGLPIEGVNGPEPAVTRARSTRGVERSAAPCGLGASQGRKPVHSPTVLPDICESRV